jgi:hypothetical protein
MRSRDVMSEHLFDPAPYTRVELGTPCVDCGVDTARAPFEFYMVHNSVWEDARMGPRGCLCIGCLEARLGRELVPADFTDVPINEAHPWDSPRLRARRGL